MKTSKSSYSEKVLPREVSIEHACHDTIQKKSNLFYRFNIRFIVNLIIICDTIHAEMPRTYKVFVRVLRCRPLEVKLTKLSCSPLLSPRPRENISRQERFVVTTLRELSAEASPLARTNIPLVSFYGRTLIESKQLARAKLNRICLIIDLMSGPLSDLSLASYSTL